MSGSATCSDAEEGELARILATAAASRSRDGQLTAPPVVHGHRRSDKRDDTVMLRPDEINALAPIRESDAAGQSTNYTSSEDDDDDDDSLDATPTTSGHALRRRQLRRLASSSAVADAVSSSSSSDDTNSSLGGETPRDTRPPDRGTRFSAPSLLPFAVSESSASQRSDGSRRDRGKVGQRWQKATDASRFSTRLKREIACTLVTPPSFGPDLLGNASQRRQPTIEIEMPANEAPMIDGTMGKGFSIKHVAHDCTPITFTTLRMWLTQFASLHNSVNKITPQL